MSERPAQDDQTRVAERYATSRPRSRIVMVLAGLALVGVVAWTAWAAWTHSHPKVSSALDSWTVVSPNEVTLTVAVRIYDAGSHPVCTAAAYASDHSTVGQLRFTPTDGTQTLSIQTEREATSVDWGGCTAQGQNDAS